MTYVVVKEAVYLHEVYGPFETVETAIVCADRVAAADRDAHHTYVVCTLSEIGLDKKGLYETWKGRAPCTECGGSVVWSSRAWDDGKCRKCRRKLKA